MKEKTFFTYNGWLFCNTLFGPDDAPPEVAWKDLDHEPTKSAYRMTDIVSFNNSDVKGCSTIKTSNDSGRFCVQIPFKVMAELLATMAGAVHEDREMYEEMIKKK